MTDASENEHLEEPRVELPPDEDERISKLNAIFAGDRHGEVDGVFFDLRHELLPPDEWAFPILGNIADITLTSSDVPLIWFPWFDNYYVESGRLIRRNQAGKNLKNRIRKPAKLVRKFGLKNPESIVEAGDTIVVERVTIRKYLNDDDFEHMHDSETRHAFLKITKKDGSVDTPFTPLVCRGTGAILLSGSESDFIRNLLVRASLLFKLNTDNPSITMEEHGLFAYYAFDNANKYVSMSDDERYADCLEFATVAAKLGYFWAKVESETNLKPLARKALDFHKSSKKGGKASADSRREEAKNGWERVARQMAKKIRADNPTYSQDTLAEKICLLCANQKIEMRGHPTVKLLIAKMEKSGELPPRPSRSR